MKLDVVTDADYLGTLARAYMAAPPGLEEHAIDNALRRACMRLDVDRDELLERISAECPVVRAVDIATNEPGEDFAYG